MKKGILIVALVLVGIVAAGALAMGSGLGANSDAQAALKAGDFNAWKTAMTAQLTQDNFNKQLERYNSRASMMQNEAAIKAAIDANDYTAWTKAISGTPMEKTMGAVITADNFPTLVQMYKAKESGDMQTAKQLAQTLGIQGKGFGCMGGHMGRGKFKQASAAGEAAN